MQCHWKIPDVLLVPLGLLCATSHRASLCLFRLERFKWNNKWCGVEKELYPAHLTQWEPIQCCKKQVHCFAVTLQKNSIWFMVRSISVPTLVQNRYFDLDLHTCYTSLAKQNEKVAFISSTVKIWQMSASPGTSVRAHTYDSI